MDHHHHDHKHQGDSRFSTPVNAEQTKVLQEELAKAKDSRVQYFLGQAVNAEAQEVREYWLNRVEGARHLVKREAAKLKLEAAQLAREQAEAALEAAQPPTSTLESKHPNGCILRWEDCQGWQPDDFMVLVREKGTQEWRSVAASTVTADTREVVLTRSLLAWGDYCEPYQIAIAAVMAGYGHKIGQIHQYPPLTEGRQPVEPRPETLGQTQQDALGAIAPELALFRARGCSQAVEWIERARQSVLGIADDPWTADEARQIARGASRQEGRHMWTLVAEAISS